MWESTYINKPRHMGNWFKDRGIQPSFAQLAAWTLTDYDRVVVLDGDTLMLQPCDELFRLPMIFAAAPETHGDQEDMSKLDPGERTYLLNAGVMVLRPSLFIFERMKKAASQPALRYLAEKIGVSGEATFQSLMDAYLQSDKFWRVGPVLWDSHGRFEGCLLRGAGSRSANNSNVVTAWMATGRIYCSLPLDYNFYVDFPHVIFTSMDYLNHVGDYQQKAKKDTEKMHRLRLMRKSLEWYWQRGLMRGTPKIVHFPGEKRKPWQRWLNCARSPWDEAWWAEHQAMCATSRAPCRIKC